MKKILLSSIIMLGVCGAVNAQNATGSKLTKQAEASTSTSAVSPTPQKAAITPVSAAVAAPAEKSITDKEAASTAPKTKAEIKAAQAAQTAVTSVNAAGEVIMTDEAKEKAEKAAAEKAASVKKNQQ